MVASLPFNTLYWYALLLMPFFYLLYFNCPHIVWRLS